MSEPVTAGLWSSLSNADAERAVVAYVLWMAPTHPADALASLDAGDFANPALRLAWETMTAMWSEGLALRPEAVHGRLVRDGRAAEMGSAAWYTDLADEASATWQVWADVVARDADSRQLAIAAYGALEALKSPSRDPKTVALELVAAAQEMGSRVGEPPAELVYVDTMLDASDDTAGGDWLIPGTLRRGWRVILTGAEGLGKMVVLRQLAWSASQGCFPFSPGRELGVPPLTTMLVDLENPRDAIQETGRQIRRAVRQQVGPLYDPTRQTIYEKPGGIDIRTRADRTALEAAIASQRPDLVVMGPLYKLFRRARHETDEQAAQGVQEVLDDLRTRHRFALVMEAHSSKGGPGALRSLEVTGSSAWMRWPEVGIGIRKARRKDGEPEAVTIERWRGDRVRSMWPARLERSDVWPWQGVWAAGTWKDPAVTAQSALEEDF